VAITNRENFRFHDLKQNCPPTSLSLSQQAPCSSCSLTLGIGVSRPSCVPISTSCLARTFRTPNVHSPIYIVVWQPRELDTRSRFEIRETTLQMQSPIDILGCIYTGLYIYTTQDVYRLLHLECRFSNLESQSSVDFCTSLLPRSVEKRPIGWRL